MNATNPSNQNNVVAFEDEDIFDDSTFLAKFQETSLQETTSVNSKSFDRSALNVSALCCDEEISGYDKLTGRTWIYPTNYPVRDYQFNIIKAALIKNTLVSLPTGLGKTFIAAVIMYNFYRWYPLGKIVFTAPTRPLVAQQIDACYNIVAIPPDDTIEMTGNMNANSRKLHWKSKRVFFATPQVVQNDLLTGICPADKIRCLVFDEAHRARGNYAYCHIIGNLTDKGCKTFRVLALSATPGSKVEDVSNVVRNLHIAHLELRTENCIDVAPYSHSRKINTVIVQLGPQLSQLRQQYVEILDGYARRLKQLNILPHNLGNLSKGRIVMLYKEYQTKDRGSRHQQHNYIMKDFTLLIALYHGLELLVKHGSRVFLNFFDEHPEKSWIQADDRLTALLERLRDDLGVNPLALDRSILPDGTIPEIPKDLTFGHPKFDKLREIMLDHFNNAKAKKQDTRAIVFCEYRESVNLVHCLLLQCRPLITPQMFVGQGASGKDGKTVVSQKQQLRIMSNFRSGASNTLVATCVAEEGLDVGSVDLIICFDISTRSPVRLVQRCGRTGRERGGQVHILVTEGREHQTLMDCMRQRDGLNKKIQQSKDVENNLYKQNPRMMPHDHTPTCQKMYITVAKKPDPKDRSKSLAAKGKKAQKDLITMFSGRASTSNKNCSVSANKDFPDANVFVTKEEFDGMFPEGLKAQTNEKDVKEYWTLNRDSLLEMAKTDGHVTNHSAWLEWQRTLQKTVNIAHTKDTEILSELLQYSDAKRFELPVSTQNPTFNSQHIATQMFEKSSPVKSKIMKPKKQKPLLPEVLGRKDGDIRALFSTATKSTKNYTKLINDLGIPNDGSLPTSLIDLLVDMSLENTSKTTKCYLCLHLGDCKLLQHIREPKKEAASVKTFLNNPTFPDINLLDDIDANAIEKCVAKPIEEDSQLFDDHIEIFPDNKDNCSRNFELEFDFDSPDIVEVAAERPSENSEKNFDIGNIEDIFAESSPEEAIEKDLVQTVNKSLNNSKDVKIEDKNSSNPKEALGFFGLDSIDDIFADSDDSLDTKTNTETVTVVAEKEIDNIEPLKQNENQIKSSKKPITNHKPLIDPVSPSLLSGSHKKPSPTSPILCSQVRKFRLSTNKRDHHSSTPIIKPKQLFREPKALEIEDNSNKMKSSNILSTSTKDSSIANTSNKSMFTITQLVEMINKTDGENSKLGQSLSKEEEIFLTQIKKDEDKRSNSPILFTQAKKMQISVNAEKNKTLKIRNNDSLIILDSDSDSDTCVNDITQVYDVEDALNSQTGNEPKDASIRSPLGNKRKLDFDNDCNNASPYFNKRLKLVSPPPQPLSLQEKIIAALSSQKPTGKDNNKNNDCDVNYLITSPMLGSQKENLSPVKYKNEYKNKFNDESKSTNRLKRLKIFRHDAKLPFSMKSQGKEVINNIDKSNDSQKRKVEFDDSDDDFILDEKKCPSPKIKRIRKEINSSIVNHKIRKKKKAKNEFLDLEAAISSESSGSGDELSDDSAGSIVNFICDDDDDDVTVQEDMHALYIKSVKSPVKGMFKIPELPKKYNDAEIFSQYAEQDADYEMDSFCVDSHIGLTQINDVSELELAEQILERKRKVRRKNYAVTVDLSDGDSPVVKRKNKNVKRRISSDSDNSS